MIARTEHNQSLPIPGWFKIDMIYGYIVIFQYTKFYLKTQQDINIYVEYLDFLTQFMQAFFQTTTFTPKKYKLSVYFSKFHLSPLFHHRLLKLTFLKMYTHVCQFNHKVDPKCLKFYIFTRKLQSFTHALLVMLVTFREPDNIQQQKIS